MNFEKGVLSLITQSIYNFCFITELFPHIFTWVCEPKEASYGLIKKYIIQHFPNLDAETGLKKAIASMVNKGQLDQLTGKGCSGTFQVCTTVIQIAK